MPIQTLLIIEIKARPFALLRVQPTHEKIACRYYCLTQFYLGLLCQKYLSEQNTRKGKEALQQASARRK
jgi:hypothetical protein